MLRENLGEFRLYSVLVFCLSWLICQSYVFAGEVAPPKMGLKALYEAAWDRQPESKSYQYRVDAAIAKQKVASSYLASPASIEVAQ